MTIQNNFLLLQINDSLFPIGSFQHSFGLESFVQKGLVCNENDMLCFMQSYLVDSLLYSDLLALKLCYEYANNLEKILEIESLLFALTTPQEIREANAKLGIRFIKTIEAMLDKNGKIWRNYVLHTLKPTHATSYGVFCADNGIDFDRAISSYLYAQSANMVVNGVKLIPLSQDSGQSILYNLQNVFIDVIAKIKSLGQESLGNNAPNYDIFAIIHQNLYSRLYMS
ncbi:urease accessory protein UreF [Helicobacter didelphidarum]|uniref:Urease accessory protein UreF n=1 Tax=Helicobacter didelphidarum TaxID=2040648 RepID=A0A3D8ILW6_9HELI|nr:urease accessory protein UreF [Helicobacter didelphidarum]RDU66219.1 urease accessory protein UreF [Helicobacter didelphidarum]